VAYAADVDRGRGLDRDFEDFHWVPSLTTPLPAGTPPVYATPPIVVWLEQHRWQLRWDKLLVYFRYNGTEPAHVAPADYLRRFAPAPLDLARWVDLGSRLNMVVPRLDAGDLPDLATAYDASVAEFDTGMQAIADVLRDPDVVQRLWLVLLAPFGDGLGEHGVIGHGATLYEQQIHVPLLIVPPPGHPAGRRYEGLVELVDVGPTILDPAGLPPEPDVRGRSLRPVLEGTALPEREAVTELAPPEPLRRHLRAVVRPGLRKRIDRPDGTYEEYDLGSDPGETRDLARPAPTGAGGS
jgi:arylsulfatase A-like enzyme